MTFTKGLRDGLPIALGYLSVAFAFGVLCVDKGLPVWFPVLISVTNFTGTGQFAGADLIAAGAPLIELAVTMVVINLRYALMSLSLSQRLPASVTTGQRLFIAFGNTDENFAVAIRQYRPLTFRYMAGLILCSYSGWVGGTAAGSLAGSVFPPRLMSALGIALFAMFIAIIVPPARKSLPVLVTVAASIGLSCLFRFLPGLKKLGGGWTIIIAGTLSALAAALIFYRKEPGDSHGDRRNDLPQSGEKGLSAAAGRDCGGGEGDVSLEKQPQDGAEADALSETIPEGGPC